MIWVWVVGVGETVEMDDRGRITIPANIRKMLGKTTFRIELIDKNTIILRVAESGQELVKKIQDIKLSGDERKASVDAASVKDFYGGIKS